jgi:predicted permease
MLTNFWTDIRCAARSFTRTPGFAAAAIVTIALGVGANTAIFSGLNGALLRELPVPGADQMVSIYQTLHGVTDRQGGIVFGRFSTSEYRAYRDRSQTLSGVVGFQDGWETTLGGEVPEEISGTLVTCNYLDVLRQPSAIGRGLTADDCETGAAPVVVLSHDLWTTKFAADPSIVGRTVQLNRQSFSVVGVASEGTYGGGNDSAYFAPISTQPLLVPDDNLYENDQNSWLFLVGRRDDNATLGQVRAELALIAAQIDQEQPGRSTTLIVERAAPLSIPLLRSAALDAGTVVMIAFGLVLLIACANVANLLLARGMARSREIALRLSLGASRARVIQQLLTESMVISVVGGALGSILALWSLFAVPAFPSLGVSSLVLEPSLDARVLSFALALTLGTGIVFGLTPAIRISKAELNAVIKQNASGPASQRGGHLQDTLVGVQVALCVVLMIGAGLLLRGLYTAQTINPGFAYSDVAVAAFDLEGGGYDAASAAAFRQQLMEQVAALPGVESVAYGRREPLSTQRTGATVRLPGEDEAQSRQAERNEVTPSYFSLLGIPIVRGRTFTDSEVANDSLVTIITETTARNFWPGEDPIGQTLLAGRGFEFSVVGVAADAQITRLGETDPYYLYLPASPRVATGQLELLVRSRADFRGTASGIQAAVHTLDPGLWVRVNPLEENLEYWRNLASPVTVLAASLGVLALVLASVGIYGVVSYFVSRRYREIGIRMALGARPRSVLALILRRTMLPVVVGAVTGVIGALAVSGVLASVLFGVSPVDPVGLAGSALFVLVVSFATGVIATRDATQADPTTILRYE